MEIVQKVPNDEAEFGGRGLEDFDPNILLSALTVEFRNETVGVAFHSPLPDLVIEGLQVVECPI